MKKSLLIALLFAMLVSVTACGKKETEPDPLPDSSNSYSSGVYENLSPQLTQAQVICKLATVECYYRNVAKYTQEKASGFLWWSKDKRFWIEYTGTVTLGIDASYLNIEVDGDNVTVTLPEAQVLTSKVDETSLTASSVYVDKDSAKITADDQTQAFREAQDKMVERAAKDVTLLANARQRVKQLLTDYINNIGDLVGKSYTITWVYIDKEGNVISRETE